MNTLKRSLAMLLVLCMLFSFVPFSVFAEETVETTAATEETEPLTNGPGNSDFGHSRGKGKDEDHHKDNHKDPQSQTEATEEVTEATEVTVPVTTEATVPETTEAMVPETTEATAPETTDVTVPENTVDPYGIMTLELDLDDEISVASITEITMGTKPSNGTTTGEPFPKGTGGSNSFRIPALVTLSNGNLVAAADARWNTTCDGGGLDTIVARSYDSGNSWNYSFANYLGDNGNQNNGTSSTAFIDPALAVINNTVFMLVDLYPYGVALNGGPDTYPSTAVGFNDDGKLLLSGDNHESYGYYLDGDTIYSSDGNAVSGYTVDEYFNITETSTGDTSNLFFSNSPYKVVRTGFLYLTKSTDAGATWSAPTLIPNVKTSSEQVCLVGPGRGLITSSGMIVYPVYSYNGDQSTQKMSFIYSKDNGSTWKRSADFTGASWSSEAAVVELSNGTLRFFYRNGTSKLCYVDYANNAWGSPVTTAIATNSNCQISAITYSKTIAGKQVILVSCPTGPSEAGSNQSGASYRLNGKIFAFTVESDGSMTQAGSVNVTSNDAQFMYSCLTELSDGTIGILYEDKESAWGTGDSCYYTMSYGEYDPSADMHLTFDAETPDEGEEDTTEIAVSDEGISIASESEVTAIEGLTDFVAYDVTLTKDGANYTGEATITLPLNGKFAEDVDLWGFVLESDGSITYVKENVLRDKEKDTVTFKAPHFSTVGATPTAEEGSGITGEDQITSNGQTGTVYVLDTDGVINSANPYLIVDRSTDGIGNVLTNDNGQVGNTKVNISEGKITTGNANMEWTFSSNSGGHITNNGYYLEGMSNSLQLKSSADYSYSILNPNGGSYQLCISTTFYGTKWYDYIYWNTTNNTWSTAYASQGQSYNIQSVYLYEKVTAEAWKVDAASQEARINNYTVSNNNYTTDSWNAYQTALTAAEEKLAAVEATSYISETAANAALAELVTAVDALEEAKNALVEAVDIIITYQFNGTTVASKHMTVASNATTATLPRIVVGQTGTAYQNDTTTLTLQDGVVSYVVRVTELEALVEDVAVGNSKTISQKDLDSLTEGQYVVWTSADTSKVSVAPVYNADGSYTTNATIVGNAVTSTTTDGTTTDTPVLVTGIVYNADGTVAYSTKFAVTVTPDTDGDTSNGAGTTKYMYINIVRIQNTTVYYSINGGELIEITDDKLDGPYTDNNGTYYRLKVPLMDEAYSGGIQISFFAAPDEGYALTYMSSTNSDGDYYCLSNGNADGVGSSAWPFADNYDYTKFDSLTTRPSGNNSTYFDTDVGIRWGLAEGNFTAAQLKVMYSNAIAKGCDGILVFTKNGNGTNYKDAANNNNCVSDLQFVSQKLPEMDKEIATVNGNPYTAGTTLKLGDKIVYNVHVYEPTPITTYGTITYSNIVVDDPLTGDNWTAKPSTSTTGTYTFVNSATGEELTMAATRYTYTTSTLTLSVSNLLELVDEQGHITNTATLDYKYQSQYSIGSLRASADAVVSAKVEVPEYVIDFGLPVRFNLTNNPLIAGYETITRATAQYGTVTWDGLTVTYTPNKILQGADFIRLTIADNEGSTDNIGYGIRVYPATTVHYEESFINWGSNWSGGNAAIEVGRQTTEQLNTTAQGAATSDFAKQHNYGYDPVYANTTGASNGTNATTQTIGAKGTFTFTGNGIQVFANCTEESGYVAVEVKNSSGKTVNLSMVDTVVDEGTTGATAGQTGNLNGLPIVSLVDLQNITHDTYTVTITKIMDTEPVKIDGIRVFNTIKDSNVFANDLEDRPEFYELRDYVLKAINITDNTSQDYGTLSELATQVYNGISSDTEAPKAVITGNNAAGIYGENATAQDLLDNGPKNELYLYSGQTLTFDVTSSRVMQIGLKAPNGATTVEAKVDNVPVDILKNDTVADTILSSVDMFYSLGQGSGTKQTITIKNAGSNILSVTLLKICDDPSFAFQPLTVESIETALLSMGYSDDAAETPVEPETPTEPSKPVEPTEPEAPTEPEVEETKPSKPEKPSKPSKPGKPGNSNKPGNTNKPGKPTGGAERTEAEAKLNIVFINLRGKKVATATMAETGTENARCVFSPAEISAQAPAGRRAIWFLPAVVLYGDTQTILVPVI